MLNITVDTKKIPSLDIERSPGYWQNVLSRLVRDKVAMFAAFVILCLLIMAILGQWITPADPYAASIMKRLKPIGFEGYPLGTDELGRDMLSRLMVGARLSLFMGITPVLLAFAIGSTIGIIAGYAGGIISAAADGMRVAEAILREA
jgi:peptide/nickel transport system permease protein